MKRAYLDIYNDVLDRLRTEGDPVEIEKLMKQRDELEKIIATPQWKRSDASRNRNKIVKIRVTETEKNRFTQKCEAAGMTQQEFFLKCIEDENKQYQKASKEDMQKIVHELMKQGTNVNQIAYKINSGQLDADTDQKKLKEEFEKINESYKKLLDLISDIFLQ